MLLIKKYLFYKNKFKCRINSLLKKELVKLIKIWIKLLINKINK